VCPTKHEFLYWLAETYLDGYPDEHVSMLVGRARHLFGNPKAARKTAWEEEPTLIIRDEL
jgi:hypothetical protein